MKKIIFSLCIFFVAISFIPIKQYFIDGFSPAKVLFISSCNQDGQSVNEELSETVASILEQKFTYLDKGRQAYVFESADKKFVLKILRKDRVSYPLWAKWSAFFSDFEKRIIGEKKKKFKFWIKSFSLVNTFAKDETGLIYCHLSPSGGLNKKILLLDGFRVEHSLNADQMIFMIQKKTIPLKDLLLKANDFPKEMVDAFFHTICFRMNKGLVNKTRRCIYNLGYLDGKIVEYDVGEWAIKRDLKDAKEFEKELNRYTAHFQKWIEKNIPDSANYFKKKKLKAISEAYQKNS